MTTWNTTHEGAPARLDVTLGGARLEVGGELTAYTHEGLEERAVAARLVEVFGARGAAEALAVASDPALAARANTDPTAKRPWHPRIFGGGRGGTWVAWIFGRTVRLSAHALDEAVDLSFEQVNASGLPGAFTKECGEEHADAIVRAARELQPLECMCGTGAQTSRQHGDLREISRATEPRSMIEHAATCARCTVCGRWWSLQARGDSHYGFSHDISLFDPGLGSA